MISVMAGLFILILMQKRKYAMNDYAPYGRGLHGKKPCGLNPIMNG
jgi:hypothetical protein